MSDKKQIVVTDWTKKRICDAYIIEITLSADQRRILRGKKFSDCQKELHLQLPREGILKDGDLLSTNHENLFIKVIAKEENLLKISSSSSLNMLKSAYHLGNRHVDIEITNNYLFIKNDNIIENLLKNINVNYTKVIKKFFPELGAFSHD